MPEFLSNLGAVDAAALILITFQAIMGLVRGFAWQLVRLATLIGALVLARLFADDVAVQIREHSSVEAPADSILAWFVILVGVFLAGTILAVVLRKMIAALRMQSYDRLLGLALGVVKGGAMVVVAILLLSQLRGASALQDALARSESAKIASRVVEQIGPLFPESLREDIIRWREEMIQLQELAPIPGSAGTDEEDRK